MADRPYPNDWLFNRMNTLEDLLRDQHSRLRQDMTANFDLIRAEIKEHQRFNDETRERTVIMETERRVEKEEVRRRVTWIGIAASLIVNAMAEVLRRVLGHSA